MSQTFKQYTDEVSRLANTSPSDPNFVALLPRMIEYAELRCYTDLQLIATIVRDTSVPLSASSPNWTGASTFVVIQSLSVITPATAATPDQGTRNPVEIVTKEFLDVVWPTRATQAAPNNVPKWAAPVTDKTFIFCPTPDAAYPIEASGTVRPAPLSAQNPTTYLTTNYAHLFAAASMVFYAGAQKNYGAQSDDPQQGMSWTEQYKTLLDSVDLEEAMRKFQSAGWSSQPPTPLATPPRS